MTDQHTRFRAASAEARIQELKTEFDAQNMQRMLDTVVHQSFHQVLTILGVGHFVALLDKDGGNVDTLHNARQGIYATDEARQAYENRGEYNSHEVHGDSRYVERNREVRQALDDGTLQDAYSGKSIPAEDRHDPQSKPNLDHVVSAKETHDDPARVLAGVDTADAANLDENLAPTTATVNKSKGAKAAGDFADELDAQRAERQARIEALRNQENRSGKEERELRKLENLEAVDTEKMREMDEEARKAQDSLYAKEYYLGESFLANTLKTSLAEGAKTGVQQLLGIVIADLLVAARQALRVALDAAGNLAVRAEVFVDAFRKRTAGLLDRVGEYLSQAGLATLSGFLSNIVTVLINTFVTTCKRMVRLIREGFASLMRALKMLVSPPENMSRQQAYHEATKLLLGGAIAIGGITLEEILEKALIQVAVLTPIASELAMGLAGLITGLGVAMVCTLLDKLDPFGAVESERLTWVEQQLDQSLATLAGRDRPVSAPPFGLPSRAEIRARQQAGTDKFPTPALLGKAG